MSELNEEIIGIDDQVTMTVDQIEATLLQQFPPQPPPEPFPGDEDATWHYWTDMDTADRGVPEEWVWERLRNRRNALLSACDFRMVPDAPWATAPWEAHRQALRDLPDTTEDPRLAVWPEPPA
jgi:hypothetical protein